MRIQQLILENFRGFEKLEMNFPEGEGGLAVLVGVNGSGKTSLLDAIVNNFYHAIWSVSSTGFDWGDGNKNNLQFVLNPKSTPVNFLKNELRLSKETSEFYLLRNLVKYYSVGNSKEFYYASNGSGTSTIPKENDNFKEFLKLTLPKSRPIFVQYTTNRFFESKTSFQNIYNSHNKTSSNSIIYLFEESFNQKINFNAFLNWFKQREDLENEIRLNGNNEHRDRELSEVRKSLENLGLGFSNPRIQRATKTQLVVKKNELEIPFDSLSDGEKLSFSMAGDIARRLTIANPNIENPLYGHGIVLIDEIELHLHPSWQRKIIPALRRTFPNVQFIVTTHSPQVISTVPKENVFILEDFKLVEKTPFTEGRDSNNLLYNIFGVEKRPRSAKEDFQKLYEFLDDENAETVKVTIKDLEEKYGKDDPDIIEAKAQIKDFFELD